MELLYLVSSATLKMKWHDTLNCFKTTPTALVMQQIDLFMASCFQGKFIWTLRLEVDTFYVYLGCI